MNRKRTGSESSPEESILESFIPNLDETDLDLNQDELIPLPEEALKQAAVSVEDLVTDEDETLTEDGDGEEEAINPVKPLTAASELSEDPVRLYLKEIGQINLLTAETEFRLSTRNEAKKRLIWLLNREKDTPKKLNSPLKFSSKFWKIYSRHIRTCRFSVRTARYLNCRIFAWYWLNHRLCALPGKATRHLIHARFLIPSGKK